MPKDINIHLKTTGGEKTEGDFEKIGQAGKDLGTDIRGGSQEAKTGLDKVDEGAEKAKSEIKDLDSAAQGTGASFETFATSLAGWAAKGASIAAIIAGITKAINLQREALAEYGRVAAEQQKALMALQNLGDFFTQHPEARKEVAAYAELGRRPFVEVAEAWYALESKGAGLSETQKRGIMQEALELGRQEPKADLSGIIEMFSLYMKETGEANANLVQNVLRQTATMAGAELSQVAQYMPQFLPVGISGGLTAAEAAGLWAYATTKTKEPSAATTGLRNIFMALQGQGTPQSQELVAGLGITPEMDFFGKLQRLTEEKLSRRFGLEQAEVIAGKENAAILLSMLAGPEAMLQTVSSVSAVARPEIDLVRTGLDKLLAADPFAREEEEGRKLDVLIENVKGESLRALQAANAVRRIELSARKGKRAEALIAVKKWLAATLSAVGVSPETTFDIVSGIDIGVGERGISGKIGVPRVRQKKAKPEQLPAEQQEEKQLPTIPEVQEVSPLPPGPPLSGPAESPATPIVNNFDNRVLHYQIFNPVTGMNKQDLGIEPPWLG